MNKLKLSEKTNLELITSLLNEIEDRLGFHPIDIDTGNCYLSEEEEVEVINLINKLSNRDRIMSKYEAYSYLNISRAKFDNLVKEGKIPQGKKQQGFKELSWYKKDLDLFIKNNNK